MSDPPSLNDSVRLPRHVVPRHYDLALEPDLSQAAFTGEATIAIEVQEATSQIVLNAAELELASAWLTPADAPDNTQPTPLAVATDPATERVSFTAAEPIAPGNYRLGCAFAGELNDQLRGFYLSTFADQQDQTQRLALTQFESTSARRAFPCWDEPDFKASFAVQLTVEPDLLAVSSMAEVAVETAEPADATANTKTVSFAPTPVIPPYLLAFVVGPLARTQPETIATRHGDVPLAIVHPPGQEHLCGFAQEVAGFSLQFLTDYFDLGYLGDKLDLIAAPDFAFGAMENVGCVTFREILLLLDETASATQERLRACDVIAHELAHMWFGNLVTMSWWNGIWLKEAFATFMELLVCDAFEPSWRRWELFCLSRAAAMEVDGLWQTRSIEYPVNTPEEAEGMYDLLSYEKGAAVVRMLEQFLTPEVFREAIRHYLQTHAYGNCDTGDLWAALEGVSGVPVDQTMESWIYAPGFPLVWVEPLAEPAGAETTGVWRLSQERFSYLPQDNTASDSNSTTSPDLQLWQIPLTLSHGSGTSASTDTSTGANAKPNSATQRETQRLLLTEESIDLELPADTQWVLPNSGGDSFIRCGYRGAHPLLAARDELTPSERFVLLDDAWALTLSQRLDVAEFLRLLSGFKTETSLAVWTRVSGICHSLHHALGGTGSEQTEAASQWWFRTLFQLEFERLGGLAVLETEPGQRSHSHASNHNSGAANTTEVLARLFGGLAILGNDAELLAWAQTQVKTNFKPAAKQASELAADLQVEAIRATASHGTAAEFDLFLERYHNASSPQEKDRYLNALALFPGHAEFTQMLEFSLSKQVRTQDAPYLLRSALKHHTLGELAWNFVKQNWAAIDEKFPSNSIGRMLEGITSLTRIPADVTQFLAAHPVPQADKMTAQHLEMLLVNAAFQNTSRNRLKAWFHQAAGTP